MREALTIAVALAAGAAPARAEPAADWTLSLEAGVSYPLLLGQDNTRGTLSATAIRRVGDFVDLDLAGRVKLNARAQHLDLAGGIKLRFSVGDFSLRIGPRIGVGIIRAVTSGGPIWSNALLLSGSAALSWRITPRWALSAGLLSGSIYIDRVAVYLWEPTLGIDYHF